MQAALPCASAISASPTGPLEHRKSLASVQLLRFVAAFAVIVCHSRSLTEHLGDGTVWFSDIVSHGALGVPVFFVISGFVIFGAASRTTSPADFLRRRLLRIYPPLWAAIGLLLLILWLFDGLAWVTPMALFNSLTLLDLDPSGGSNVLFVAWTLSYELLFYVVVALLLILPLHIRRPVTAALVGALALTTSAAAGWVPSLFSSPLIFSFIFGLVAASARLPRIAMWPAVTVAIRLWLTGLALNAEASQTLTALLFGGGTALFLAAVKTRDFTGATASVSRWLGDASYALYLTHPVVLSLLLVSGWYADLAAALTPAGMVCVYLAAALLTGALFHLVVERRGGKWARRVLSDAVESPARARTAPA